VAYRRSLVNSVLFRRWIFAATSSPVSKTSARIGHRLARVLGGCTSRVWRRQEACGRCLEALSLVVVSHRVVHDRGAARWL
ncbi:unnamed protein product, partial [Ectocarpus sp. 8 AP-2014]